MLKKIAVAFVCLSLLAACGSEQPSVPATIPVTAGNDPAKEIADKALALSYAKQFDQAAALFKQAAEQGNRPAMYFLGLLYARGDGVSQDINQAFKWLHQAAMGGHPKAVYHLGEMYVKGEGTETDHVKAMAWFWVGTTLGDRYSEKRLRAVAPRLNATEIGDAKVLSKELVKSIPHDLKVERKSLH